jgi:hypothetical protein
MLGAACSRTARIPARELPRLHAHPREGEERPIVVHTTDGRRVEIHPSFKFARIVPRDEDVAPEAVYRPPFRAAVNGDVLLVEDAEPFSYRAYRLTDVERVEVAQRDPSRALPLLYGGLIGAAVGGAFGLAIAEDCADTRPGDEPSQCYGRGTTAAITGVLGAGLGVLIGLPIALTDKYY